MLMMNETLPPNYPDKALSTDPRLVQLLLARAFINGHSVQEMCDHLRVTFGFFNQLRNGIRKTEDISDQFAEAVAGYLGVTFSVVAAAVKRA